ncbi:MAG: DUF5908 family protein [Bacteroidota bacterium]
MALEIREMILRTTLTGKGSDNNKQDSRTYTSEIDMEAIIEACMQRIKEEMRYRNER